MEYIKKIYGNKIVKSGIWYTVGNIFLQGMSFITIFLFTRMMSKGEYGSLSVYYTWMSIFTNVVSLGLVSSVSRAKYDYEEKYDDFLGSIMTLASMSFLLFAVIFVIFRNTVAELTGLTSILVILLVIQSFGGFVIDFYNVRCSIEFKYKKYLGIAISSTLLNIVLSIIFISYLKANKYMGRVWAGVLVTFVYSIVIYYSIMKGNKTYFNKKYWKYALAMSVPLIPHTLSAIILSQFDRIMIKKLIGDTETGIYSFASNIGMIMNIVWISLNRAWVPYFFESMKKKNYDDIQKKCRGYMFIFSVLTIGLICISPEIAKILVPKSYWEGINIVPIVALSYFFVFLYSLPSNLEFYAKKTYLISAGTFIAAFVNIALNYLLIPIYGYQAAAYATLVSYIVLFTYHYCIAKFVLKDKVFKFKYFVYSILFTSIGVCAFYVFIDNWIARYSFLLLAFLILGFIGKKYFKKKVIEV